MKKLLSTLLAIAMIATMIPTLAFGAVAVDANEPTPLPTDAISVGTRAAFLAYLGIKDPEITDEDFAALSKGDADEDGVVEKSVSMIASINMEGYDVTAQLTTLGDGVIIEGNGHSITNFTMTGTSKEFSLFKAAEGANVTVRNLTFGTSEEGGKIAYNYTSAEKGGFAGFLFANEVFNATIENLTVYTDMKNTTLNSASMGVIAGTVCGKQTYINVNTHGSISAVLDGTNGVGSLVGYVKPGCSEELLIQNCTNNAKISASANNIAGGFIGYLQHDGAITFKNCVNNGAVTSTNAWVGGFIGQAFPQTTANVVWLFDSCVNNGAVSGKAFAGGFIGYVNANNHPFVEAEEISFAHCENHGEISTTGSYAAGFIAYVASSKVSTSSEEMFSFEYCVNGGDIKATTGTIAAGFIGHSALGQSSVVNELFFNGCVNRGDVTTKGVAGGFIGQADIYRGIVTKNSTNYGKVEATNGNCAAGFIGYSLSKRTLSSEGEDLLFEGCINYGTAAASNHRVAGLAAFVAPTCGVKVVNCANHGDISGINIGGAFGYVQPLDAASKIDVAGFVNFGTVASGNYGGGLIGYITRALNAYQLENCVNFGTISGPYVGGLLGNNLGGLTIKNSMNAGTVSGTNKSGSFVGDYTGADDGKSSNYYVSSDANTLYGTNAVADLDAAVATYNSDMSTVWGKVTLDNGKVVLANPVFLGVQRTNALKNDGTYSIRLISVINTAKYSKVGYQIRVNDSSEMPIYCTTAYTGINETVNGKVNIYTASDFGGAYVYALNVDDLDPNTTYTFTITSVAYGPEAEGGAEEYIGATYTFKYVNGVFGGYVVNSSEVQS